MFLYYLASVVLGYFIAILDGKGFEDLAQSLLDFAQRIGFL